MEIPVKVDRDTLPVAGRAHSVLNRVMWSVSLIQAALDIRAPRLAIRADKQILETA